MTTSLLSLLDEPELEFRFGQRCRDPHAGLGLFGPFDSDLPSQPGGISYGVVGTDWGIDRFATFAERVAGPVVSRPYGDPERVDKQHMLWPPFPGFDAAFAVKWSATPGWTRALDAAELERCLREADPYKRAFGVVGTYLDAIRVAAQSDERLGLLICVVPEEIWLHCRPQSRGPSRDTVGRKPSANEVARRRVQPDLFQVYDPMQYSLSVDFRRQLKARSMEYGIPIQIVRESTLEIGDLANRNLTPLSDRAWNLATTIYYKAGGKPWRLSSARDGVCYVGLAFKRAQGVGTEETACCAAQMFLDSGDGVVFRGEFGPWYSPEKKQFHLDRKAARDLLEGVLATYHEQGGRDLREIFLHSRSEIASEEFEGYREACPASAKLVGIRVRRERDGLRAFRPGRYPVIRGTLWRASPTTGYLWTAGFKPDLLTYDGWETPVPLRIDIQHGVEDIDQVARDILGLTKLDYNTCKVGDADPVTIKFSDAVGEILISNPTVKFRRPNFKYYI